MATQWFISDLHLAIERASTLALFEQFLARQPQAGDRVYILGDLFDAWIGDDDDAELANRARRAMAATSRRGVALFVQRGNRDFLMGERLMQATGATLLPDRFVTTVAGQATLLMHGDLLCTDDVGYLRTRRILRNPLFQWFMLRKPLAERRRVAADYRRRSKQMTAVKSAEIMDANDDTVVRYLRRHKVAQLIHGHTHRPALHEHRLPDGTLAKRLVLPEWHGERAVAWADDGSSLGPVELTLDPDRGDQIAAGDNSGRRANPAGNSNSAASAS